MVALLLCSGLDINAMDHRGMTCLHSAAKQSTAAFLACLLKRGADPNRVARGKQSIFHFAAYNHDADAWLTLLRSIPDPFPLICMRNRAGVTPLQLCCILGNAAGVTECCKYFKPPLQIIDMSSSSVNLNQLIKRSNGASPVVFLTDALRKKPSKAFLTTVFQAQGQDEISNILNKPRKGMARHRWPEGGSWLHYCAHNSNEDSVTALARFGAKSFLDQNGFLPLHYALRRSLPTASIHIALSMTIDNWQVMDSRNRSFLHWICCFAAPPPGLNANKTSVPLPTSTWDPFWHKMSTMQLTHNSADDASSSTPSSVLAFICNNPALTGVDSVGNRPIHLLAMRDLDGHALKLMCKHTKHKELWSLTKRKHNILHLAAANCSPLALHVLLKALDRSSRADSTLDKDAILNQRDARGLTPLHHAVKSASNPSIQSLIDAGAMPDIKDRRGRTPVALAARHKSLLVLVQLIDNGVCSIEEARQQLTSAGFRSSIPELDSLKMQVDVAAAHSDSVSLSAPHAPASLQALDPTRPASIIDGRAIDGRFDLSFSIPMSYNYDVREGERYPLNNRRCGSAPPGESITMIMGRNSPRNGSTQPANSHVMTTSASAPNWSAPRSPTLQRFPPPNARLLSASDEIHREINRDFIRDNSSSSVHSGTSSDDEFLIGSPISVAPLPVAQTLHPHHNNNNPTALYINLDHARTNNNKPVARSVSSSPPRSPVGTVIPNWGGPASPTSTPLSPHLSPRSMSPQAGRQTPPTTPNSQSALDRMKLHRSLSPRSLPTIKETGGNTPTDPAAKDTKASTGRRQRSGSNTSLAKKTLLARSVSLTKLPTNLGEDFLEQIKMDQSPGYGGGTTPRSYHTLHPGSLDQHYGNILQGHVKSHSDHSAEEMPSISTVSPKKRHKSQDRHSSQGKKSSRSSPAAAPNALHMS